ncbi:MAG: patatin-like phospholipase family protein [Bacteroidetes bacterium]|nr:patatin-like phospholipase family protein [Bacteroidota bacterium]
MISAVKISTPLSIIFTCFLFLHTHHSLAQKPYQNLVFEGGGIRGIAYAGTLSILEQEHITDNIKRTAGTSVGAIVATLVAVGYTASELKDILYNLKIQQFNDGEYVFIGGIHRVNKYYGWYKGDKIEQWVGKLIAQKTRNEHLTFEQLHQLTITNKSLKDVYITSTNLSKQCKTVFSYENYPAMEIQTAVRASLSIPLYYKALFLDSLGAKAKKKSHGGYDIYVDGGIVANYPISIFDNDTSYGSTLGLKLERPEQVEGNKPGQLAPYRIFRFANYIGALYNIIIEHLNRDTNSATEQGRTIYISTGNIAPKVKRISNADKDLLYSNGISAAKSFIAKQKSN